MPPFRRRTEPCESAMRIKWLVASILAALACFAIPRPGEADAPSASRGKETFEKRCGGCHALDRDKEGPRLGGVYGRPAGSIPSFEYSAGVKRSKIVWMDDTLNKWLTSTESLVPDNDMTFRVENPDERREIIAYLKQSSGK